MTLLVRAALLFVLACAMTPSLPAAAQSDNGLGYRVYTKPGKFADVRDDLKEAIINRGFVIDYVGHFNNMLERTADVAGSVSGKGAKSPYANAEYLQFCPSKLTHEAVSATPFSIANCPIAVFVYELAGEPGKVTVGYRLPVATPSKRMQEVNAKLTALLDSIAREATK